MEIFISHVIRAFIFCFLDRIYRMAIWSISLFTFCYFILLQVIQGCFWLFGTVILKYLTSKIFGIADDVSAFLLKLERFKRITQPTKELLELLKYHYLNQILRRNLLTYYLFPIIESKCNYVYNLYSPKLTT